MLNSRYSKRNSSSRPNHILNNQNVAALNALTLPNELLRIIFFYVEAKRDLAALCCTSRVFQLEAERLMYGSIQLPMLSYDVGQKFLCHLKHERISSLVTQLTVRLPDPFCMPRNRKTTPFLKIRCKLLNSFEQALSGLGNLASLSIVCASCKHSTHNHDYFRGLKTTSLRTFKFRCEYVVRDAGDAIFSTLSIRNVEVLDLHVYPLPPWRDLLSDIFPNLRHLINGPDSLCYTTLTRYQPIQITCFRWTQNFHQVLEERPQSVRVLRATSEPRALCQFIQTDPHPYRFIKHIGEIQIWKKEGFMDTLEVLALLPVLVSFDAVCFLGHDGQKPLWTPQYLEQIHLKLPWLKKVFLDMGSLYIPPLGYHFVWEFKENGWQRKVSSRFSGWDLLDEKWLIE